MLNFEFTSVPRIVFGRGSLSQIGELIAHLGRRPMVVSFAGPPQDGNLTERLAGDLTVAGIDACYWQQSGEPTVVDVAAALEAARDGRCDCVIGLGGGSSIDAAKAVAGLLTNGGSPLDYMEVIGQGLPLTEPAAPWIAVPTTAGTGAEVTRNAVLGCPEKNFKASLRSPGLLASIALIDPDLGVGVPPAVTASSGMDALCQVIESYTSNKAQPITDGLALQGIALAARALPRAFAEGTDLDAREDMALAAMLSGMTLANVGLGAVHGFAAPLGANLPIPHGTVCAALLPHVIRANIQALKAAAADHPWLERYARVGRVLADDPSLDRETALDTAFQLTRDLAKTLQIPPLAQFGLAPELIPDLVELARKASSMKYNPIALSASELTEILEKAAAGLP
jgi:alcohol dehydrogenase class IV